MKKRHGPIDLSHVDTLKKVPITQEQVRHIKSSPVTPSPITSSPSRRATQIPAIKKKLRHMYGGFIIHTKGVWDYSTSTLRGTAKKIRSYLPSWTLMNVLRDFSTYAKKTKTIQERLFASFILCTVIALIVLGTAVRSYAIVEDVRSYSAQVTKSLNEEIRSSIHNGEYLKAQVQLKGLVENLSEFQKLLPTNALPIFENDSWVLSLHRLIDVSRELSSASDSLLVVYGNITQFVVDSQNLPPEKFKERYKSLTEYMAYQWQLLKENVMPALNNAYVVLEDIPLELFPEEYRKKITSAKQTLGDLKHLFDKTDELIPKILLMLGEKEPKTYAILLQNSMEMRATGGFIGSIVLVKVNDGWIEKLEFRDVYDFDGQVFEPIPAPKGIDTISKNFRLRDANYWPDFPTSAKQVAWFLDKQKGPGVDGVIAINDTVIRDLLTIIGPLSLPNTDDKVDANSFLPIISYIVESKLAGKQPKEVLFAFSETFIKEFKAQLFKKPELLLSILANMDQKSIVAFGFDEEVEDLFRRIGISGEIFQYDSSEKNRIDDYIMLVHTAIGANKSDYFVKERMSHSSIVLADGRAENTVVLERAYDATPESMQILRNVFESIAPLTKELERILLSGDNIHYLRWYLPARSTDIRIEGIDAKDISVSNDLGKTVVGFTHTLKPGEKRDVILHYTVSTDLDVSQPLTYRLVAEKEPGGKNIPFIKQMKTASGTVIADYTNSKMENKIQPLRLEEEQKELLLGNRSLISYLLYFGK